MITCIADNLAERRGKVGIVEVAHTCQPKVGTWSHTSVGCLAMVVGNRYGGTVYNHARTTGGGAGVSSVVTGIVIGGVSHGGLSVFGTTGNRSARINLHLISTHGTVAVVLVTESLVLEVDTGVGNTHEHTGTVVNLRQAGIDCVGGERKHIVGVGVLTALVGQGAHPGSDVDSLHTRDIRKLIQLIHRDKGCDKTVLKLIANSYANRFNVGNIGVVVEADEGGDTLHTAHHFR